MHFRHPPGRGARPARGRVILALLPLGIILLSGCSGSGPDEQDQAAIEATVVRALTSDDPAICAEVLSEGWLQEHFAAEDQDARSRCEEVTAEEPSRKADSATVSDVTSAGGRAVVTAEITGGNVGSASMDLVLVDADGWRIDELTDIEIERDAYLAAQRAAVANRDLFADAQPLMDCMLDYAARHVTTAQIERSLLAGNESFYVRSFASCRSEFRRMFLSPTTIASGGTYSQAQATCISKLVGAMITRSELAALYRAFLLNSDRPETLAAKRELAIARCS